MPKNTFYHLSDEKKGRIFDAAVQEFSTRRFSEASVNQIIKNAGIPKGSFYQYFTGKEDIYLYMLEEISKEKKEFIRNKEVIDPDADFFETIIQKTRNSFELGRIKPEYTEIGMLMEIDNSEFITNLRAASAKKLRKMIERDKERGLIKPETDADLVFDLIYTFTIQEYFRTGSDEKLFLKRLNDAFKMLKEGIAMEKD